jgi:hypothetical protein
MANSTLLALLTAVSMLCAISMAAFAWKMNEDWANHCDKINKEWAEFYKKMTEDKHDC